MTCSAILASRGEGVAVGGPGARDMTLLFPFGAKCGGLRPCHAATPHVGRGSGGHVEKMLLLVLSGGCAFFPKGDSIIP